MLKDSMISLNKPVVVGRQIFLAKQVVISGILCYNIYLYDHLGCRLVTQRLSERGILNEMYRLVFNNKHLAV